MPRNYYKILVDRLNWRLALSWAVAMACGLLVGSFLSSALGVISALCLLAVLLVVTGSGDRSDELLDILWVKDRTLGSYRAEIEELELRGAELKKRAAAVRSKSS